jgi:glycosyltransferase involved in cell wall biosynthesis
MEATTVTGPAKNLLNFCRLMQSPEFAAGGKPPVEVSIVTFHRQHVSEPGAVAMGSDNSSCIVDPIATALGSDTSPNAFVKTAREMGITVDVITERFRFDPSVVKELRAIVARQSPDVIQTHMIKSHFLVKLAGLGKRYPWIAYHHGYTTTNLKMRGYNQLNLWTLPSATRVITVCRAFANQLSLAGVRADRINVCHNSVVAPRNISRDEQKDLRRQLGIIDAELVVLAVGRLSKEKGHHDLFSAIALLRQADPELNFKLVILGEGPERPQLEKAIQANGLGDFVTFAGQINDVAPYYAIADTLALPSHSEGSPNVLLEAMAAQVPIVATDVGGVPEIATDEEHALLVPARNPKSFAEALHRLLTTPALARKLSVNARARAEKDFSPEAYARSLIGIYRELLSSESALVEPELVSV